MQSSVNSGAVKWTEAIVIEHLKNLCDSLGYFPSSNETRRLGRYGLSSAVDRFGGYVKFSSILGISPRTRRSEKWEESKILEEINKLKLKEFPTSNYLKSINRNDLSCAISRNGGWKYFSEKTNLPLTKSDTLTGWGGEDWISDFLSKRGYKIARGSTKEHFDILVDDCVRIDVKTASYAIYGDKDQSRGWFYRMGKTISADIAILYRKDQDDFYVIPWFLCPSTNATITESGGWYKNYLLRLDILDEMIKTRKLELEKYCR